MSIVKRNEDGIKHILVSKTLWVNVIAMAGFILNRQFGYQMPEEFEAELLGIINIILRGISKEPVRWQ